jgi:hypothetical protein
VGEVEVPLMRRCIRAFGHVAEVAQIALVNDLHVILLVDAIDFHRLGLIHEIEQRREGGAQRYTATATMADIVDALKLCVHRIFVVKVLAQPIQRMTGRGLKVTFS